MSYLRIAFVLETFSRAGAQRHFFEILKGIRKFRSDIVCDLFLLSSSPPGWSSFEPEAREAGISIYEMPYVFARRGGDSFNARVLDYISRTCIEKRLNAGLYSLLGKYDSIVCGQPFVADLLVHNVRKSQRLVFHLLEHKAQRESKLISRIIANPRFSIVFQHYSQVLQSGIDIGSIDSIVWPLRVGADFIGSPPMRPSNSSDSLAIVHYSRISPMRFIDKIINAFSELRLHHQATLSIVGHVEDKNYYSALAAQIDRLGLAEFVSFSDSVQSLARDLATLKYDMVWMISISGHVGYAAIESMAAGFPTLLLEVDASSRSLDLETDLKGLICFSADEIASRSLLVKSNPDLFCRNQNELVRNRFIVTESSIRELTSFYI
jgi:glycosyltransferase involved in cell wall biosynthesis